MKLGKSKISYFKTKRLNVFLLFVVLALLFSVLSKLSNTYTRTFKFAIVPINLPDDHVIISDSLAYMDITITTYGFKHAKYYLTNPEIELDFNGLDKNNTHYSWIELKGMPNVRKQFDADVTVDNVTPDTLLLRYDKNFVKTVPVRLNSDIMYATGFDLTEPFKLEPDSVKIIGPKVILDSIAELETNNLKLEQVNFNINQKVDLKTSFDNSEVKLSAATIVVSGNIEKFTEGEIVVPISVVNVPKGVNVNFYPKTTSVIFYTSLNNYKNITTSSFIVECDYSLLTDETTFLSPKVVKQPAFVKSVRLNIKQVEFILTQ
jgi:hypothetical protein